MANWVADRIVETSTTTGTGSWSLNGAVSGYQSWISGIGNGNTGFYFATDGTNWEVGYGVVTSGTPNTLSRATVIANSAGTAVALSFPSGTKYIFNDVPASRTPFWGAAVAMSSALAYYTAQVSDTGSGLELVGPAYGVKNKLMNGGFAVWQRGTSIAASAGGVFTADRWQATTGTSATVTVSQQALTAGERTTDSTHYLRLARTVTGSTAATLFQRIEDVQTLSGKTATLSFYAKCSASTVVVTPTITQNFGSGGSPSANVVTVSSPTTVTTTTTWTRHTVTFTVPSISGKTYGTTRSDYLQVTLSGPASGTYTVDISDIQLEEGPAETAFEQRPEGLELMLCQRFYAASTMGLLAGTVGGSGSIMTQVISAAATVDREIMFPVQMRAAPTVTVFSPGTGVAAKCHDYTAVTDRNAVAVAISPYGCYVAMDGGAALARQAFEYNAAAEL
jgi:hypothetical protein